MKPNLIGDCVHKGSEMLYVMPAYILSMKHKSKQPRRALVQGHSKKNKGPRVKMAIRCQVGNPCKDSISPLAY